MASDAAAEAMKSRRGPHLRHRSSSWRARRLAAPSTTSPPRRHLEHPEGRASRAWSGRRSGGGNQPPSAPDAPVRANLSDYGLSIPLGLRPIRGARAITTVGSQDHRGVAVWTPTPVRNSSACPRSLAGAIRRPDPESHHRSMARIQAVSRASLQNRAPGGGCTGHAMAL